jgi:L-threonylcarbamoyladenylate synthase
MTTPLATPTLVSKLANGAVGVLPTDTVYGVVCSAHLTDAVQRLYGLKDRQAKPGTIIANSLEQLVELGIPARYLKPVEHYWPNSITIVVPAGNVSGVTHQNKGTLAVRIPKNDELQSLLQQTGPLLTSSANQPGQPPAATISEAKAYFGDEVDFYIDGGDLSDRLPSTIIRIIDDAVEVIRPGAVVINEAGEIVE